MGPELAVFRAIIELFWPTLCLAKMAILNTVHARMLITHQKNALISFRKILANNMPVEIRLSDFWIQNTNSVYSFSNTDSQNLN